MNGAMPYDQQLLGGRGKRRDPSRVGDWLQTWTGARFYPGDPRAEEIDILDIAHALANTTRYAGHCRFYSVAEHSVLVSQMVPPEHAFVGLMHDATEAYINDLIRPVKLTLGRSNQYFSLEEAIWKVIAAKYQLPADMPHEVKEADSAICIIERRCLHPRADEWEFTMAAPEGVRINALEPRAACTQFLARFCDLAGLTKQDETALQRRLLKLYHEDDVRMAHSCGGLIEPA